MRLTIPILIAALPSLLDAQSAAERAARLERSIVPAARVAGRDTSWTLLERMRERRVPGVSIAVVDSFRVVWTKGFGMTEFGGATRVDSTTLFLAGSISKPVAATAALAMVERGQLALDEDVNRRLTSWKLPESPWTATEKVTLRRLLSHSAGLTVWGFPGYAKGVAVPTVPQLLDGTPPANTAAVRNDTVPGARWLYSGGGYTIAQLLMSDVAREPFPLLAQRLVLAPVGMRRSTYASPLPDSLHARAATGHERPEVPIPGKWHTYPEMAAAGLWTTGGDLARWGAAVMRAARGDRDAGISPQVARWHLTPTSFPSSRYGGGAHGLGPALAGAGDSARFSHNGRDEGFIATLVMWPARGQGLVVLTNGTNGALLGEITRSFAALYGLAGYERREVTLAAADTTAWAGLSGRWRARNADSRMPPTTVERTAGGLGLVLSTGARMSLVPVGPLRFVGLDNGASYAFERGDDGAMRLRIGEGPGAAVLERLPATP